MVTDLGIQTDDDIAEKIKQAIRSDAVVIVLADIDFIPASDTDSEHFQARIVASYSDKDILKT